MTCTVVRGEMLGAKRCSTAPRSRKHRGALVSARKALRRKTKADASSVSADAAADKNPAERLDAIITDNVIGRRASAFPLAGSEEGRRRRGAQKKRTALAEARSFIAAAALDQPATIDNAVAAACSYSMMLRSGSRLAALVGLLQNAPAAVFWRVLLEHWMHCENTWACLPDLLGLIRRHVVTDHPSAYLADDALGFLQALPPVVTVYRGCSRQCVHGIAWTTDREVAEGFAHGHRFIPVHDPVIATGTIARDLILAVFIDRNETEVLVDPRDLKITKLKDYPTAMVRRFWNVSPGSAPRQLETYTITGLETLTGRQRQKLERVMKLVTSRFHASVLHANPPSIDE